MLLKYTHTHITLLRNCQIDKHNLGFGNASALGTFLTLYFFFHKFREHHNACMNKNFYQRNMYRCANMAVVSYRVFQSVNKCLTTYQTNSLDDANGSLFFSRSLIYFILHTQIHVCVAWKMSVMDSTMLRNTRHLAFVNMTLRFANSVSTTGHVRCEILRREKRESISIQLNMMSFK